MKKGGDPGFLHQPWRDDQPIFFKQSFYRYQVTKGMWLKLLQPSFTMKNRCASKLSVSGH
jgi:hypothetical protein